MLTYTAFLSFLLWLSLLRPLHAADWDFPGESEDDRPGMQVAVRQSLFDYGITVGSEALSSHIQNITIPRVETTINVPLVGEVDLTITNIKCLEFNEPTQLAKVEIENTTFSASSKAISAKFQYHWAWSSRNLPLDGDGDGSIEFDSGDVAMNFSVVDDGGPQLRIHTADIHFEDIQVEAHGSLSWLYNAMLVLFHDQIVTKIEARMNQALMHDVPAKLNSYLQALPSTVVIQGLPISAAFRYAIYTHGFLMVRAFPTVGASAPPHALPSQSLAQTNAAPLSRAEPTRPGAAAAAQLAQLPDTAPRTDAVIQHGADADRGSSVGDVDTESIRLVGGALVSLFDAAWLRWQPPQADSAVTAAGRGISGHAWPLGENGQRCPDSTAPLEVSDAEIAADSHMATLFVNDAVPQCLLWALHRRSLLHYTVKDGELPGIRLLTDLFAVLVPGVQKDYPHRSIALSVNATAEPEVAFLADKGARVAGSYETRVYVLPEDAAAERDAGGLPAGAIEVAVLDATVSGVVDLQFNKSKVSDLEVKYTVKDSKYKISAWAWEATIRYVVGQAEVRVGVEALWDKFVAHGVASALHAQHALGKYRPGWFQLAVDFRVDLDG